MKFFPTLLVAMLAFAGSGCDRRSNSQSAPQPTPEATLPAPSGALPDASIANGDARRQQGQQGQQQAPAAEYKTKRARAVSTSGETSLATASEAEAVTQAIERKIIRNGRISVETDDPLDGQRKITSIAESRGGFVVTTEFKQDGKNSSNQSVIIAIRVPAPQFDETIAQIRATGRVLAENVSGQDVTEEFLDLEARLKTQKALEIQFLEIMKQARKVEDALQVQSEIANVRTEIERIEGRRRFLANQAALSTLTVTLSTPAPVVITATTTGFGHSVRQAFADGIDFAVEIILALIRLLIMLVPVAIFILLPAALIFRFFFRRWRANRRAAEPVPQE